MLYGPAGQVDAPVVAQPGERADRGTGDPVVVMVRPRAGGGRQFRGRVTDPGGAAGKQPQVGARGT
jgi:hypothetical protein